MRAHDEAPSLKRQAPRVFDAGYEEMLEEVALDTNDFRNPIDVFLIGDEQNVKDFGVRANREFEADAKRLRHIASERKDGIEVCFSLATEANAKGLIALINSGQGELLPGQIKKVVVIYPPDEDSERYLPLLLERCPEVPVYFVSSDCEGISRRDTGQSEIEVPSNVDFTAPDSTVAAEVDPIPADAMYGNLHGIAVGLACPMGFAYPAMLAAAAGFGIKASGNIRPTVYVALLGDVHSGKSVTRDRASQILPINNRLVTSTPVSDRGLFKLFASTVKEDAGESFLLSLDEARAMMSKGAIDKSTLASTLCELWSKNEAGAADKTVVSNVNLKLSILGGIKIKNPEEFPEVFSFATAHGLYDRFLFGHRGAEDWDYTPLTISPIDFRPTCPTISDDVYALVKQWRRQGQDRDRLGELALRVAFITSAANFDDNVNAFSIQAALRFMEWQERIRSVYQPAKGANEHQECMNAVLDAFEKAPGKCLNWRIACQRFNWHRRFPKSIRSVKTTLERDGVIQYDKDHRKHFYRSLEEEK